MIKTEPENCLIDVADHPVVWLWMKETLRRDPDGFFQLIGFNYDFFRRIYGRPSWTRGQKGGKVFNWMPRDQGLRWVVTTGPEGTVFRIQTNLSPIEFSGDRRIGMGITQTLSGLLSQLT